MRILITGGDGFIGSNIVNKLNLEGHNEIYKLSKDCKEIRNTVLIFQPDIIIHCGWYGGNNYIDTNNPNQFYKNINYSVELVESLKEIKKKTTFVGFGSFAEYGPKSDVTSEIDLENPIDLYGLSKYTFKQYSQLVCSQNNIDWLWIRPCYVYGPGDVETRLIPKIINKFIRDESIILDSCNKCLDYIYIDDFINMMYELIKQKCNGVFNICSGNQYNLRSIITLIEHITKSKSRIKYNRALNRDSKFSFICGDNSKIINAIGLEPSINIINGLIKTVNYYKSER